MMMEVGRWGAEGGRKEERERNISRCCSPGLKYGGRGHKPRRASDLWKLEMARK